MDTVIIAIPIFAVALIVLGVKRIPQGKEYTVERFGRYSRTLRPGLNLIFPLIDQINAQLLRVVDEATAPWGLRSRESRSRPSLIHRRTWSKPRRSR